MLFFLVSFAFAAEPNCANTVEIPLAEDTTHTVWKTHIVDVAAWRAKHRLGHRDYQPLIVDTRGGGDWCIEFGSLRPVRDAIGAELGTTIGIAISTATGQTTLKPSTGYNVFTVAGLKPFDVVVIEFLRIHTPQLGSCARSVDPSYTTQIDGLEIPMTTYACSVNGLIEFSVIERREYTTNPEWHPTPQPKSEDPQTEIFKDMFNK